MTTTIDLEQKALALPDEATALMITDVPSYARACAFLLDIKAVQKELDATFDPIINKQFQAHREAVAQKKRHEQPLLRAEQIIKPRIAAYRDEQERTRRIAEQRANEAAQLQEALDAEALGDAPQMEAVLNGQGVVNVCVPSIVPNVSGIVSRELWSADVTDFLSLVKAVASGQVPLPCLLPNQSALNQQARALKQDMKYPGVKAVYVKTVAAGARL